MILIRPPLRSNDDWGAGHYGAPRGTRTHRGTDFAVLPGSEVCAVRGGRVTRLGFPYGDDLSIKYVEVTGEDGYRLRYFYVEPSVAYGQKVALCETLGTAQSLQHRYPRITDHVHLEVWTPGGTHTDPIEYLNRTV